MPLKLFDFLPCLINPLPEHQSDGTEAVHLSLTDGTVLAPASGSGPITRVESLTGVIDGT